MDENKWISTEEKFPNKNKMVLCCTDNQPIVKYVVAYYEPRINLFIDYEDCAYSVTHWMSLPKLPKIKF